MVSICILNYNNGRYIEACIQSALDQTYRDTEVVLVDDNSTDGSFDIVRKYSGRIKIYRNSKNLGQPENTNRCVKLSRGKYCVILHGDDKLLPDFASKLAPLLDRHPNAAMAVGERMLSDEKGKVKKIAPLYDGDYLLPGLSMAKVFMMTGFLPCQVLLRRSVFDKIGSVDPRHIVNLDGLLWFKCALEGDIAYIQDPVSIYRIHPKQITAVYNRGLNHMMEYYITLSAMFEAGKEYKCVRLFFEEAVKKVAPLTLRYTIEVVREKNYDLARKYLTLSTVFDPYVAGSEEYQKIKKCLEAASPKRDRLAKKLVGKREKLRDRGFSYQPPPGSTELNRI